jgi:DeoR/GlpR family transcriptional regulator of sugar metabolism
MYYSNTNKHIWMSQKMNMIERQSLIVEIVNREGSIQISDICHKFDVSDMTARRDLNELDRRGLIRRIHGGAITNYGRSYEPPFQTRSTKNQEAKHAIGNKAAELIYDGDSIALDVGTTTLEIVKGLVGKHNLTIITSSLQIANLIVKTLSLETDARLIITGGIVRPRELSMIGSIAERAFEEFHVDKAFIGIGGINIEAGLTEYNMEDAQTKKMLIKTARENIIVADGSKMGGTTFAKVAPLDSIDKIVTDRSADPELIEKIRKLGVEIIFAD